MFFIVTLSFPTKILFRDRSTVVKIMGAYAILISLNSFEFFDFI
jgi:hypothetical protein